MSDAPGPVTPPPAPEWPPFPPPQPGAVGSVYPLDMGRIFELTFSLFRYRWQTFLGATLAIMLPASILLALFQFVSGSDMARWYEELQQLVAQGRQVDLLATFPWQTFLLGWLGGIIAGVVGLIAEGAIVHAAAITYGGGKPTVGQSVGKALARLLSLVGVFLISFLAVVAIVLIAALIGAVLIGVGSGQGPIGPGPGVFLALVVVVAAFVALVFISSRWIMAVQAVVLEGLGAVDALGRSWRLVAGSTWRVIGYTLVFGLVFGLLAVLLSTVLTFFIAPEFVAPRLDALPVIDPARAAIATLVSSVISLLVMPFPAIGFTLLYYDLCWRRGETVPAPGGGEIAGSGAAAERPAPLG